MEYILGKLDDDPMDLAVLKSPANGIAIIIDEELFHFFIRHGYKVNDCFVTTVTKTSLCNRQHIVPLLVAGFGYRYFVLQEKGEIYSLPLPFGLAGFFSASAGGSLPSLSSIRLPDWFLIGTGVGACPSGVT